jgi:hypothetical protein
MKTNMMAYCGTYCETCDWKDKMNCKGCKLERANPFWGVCKVASCAIRRGFPHCGQCPNLPCQQLKEAFNNPEHGDSGERMENLVAWSQGKESMLKVRTKV